MGNDFFISGMMNLELSTLAATFAIIATILTGAVWVMTLVNKITSRVVSQEKDLQTLKKDVDTIVRTVKEHESKNSYFRHNFDPVTKSLFNKMDDLEETIKDSINEGFKHVKELFDTKLQNVEGKINEKK